MAVDTEAKRWSMMQSIHPAFYPFSFNPDTSGLQAIERATLLKIYAGNALAAPSGSSGSSGQKTTFTKLSGIATMMSP